MASFLKKDNKTWGTVVLKTLKWANGSQPVEQRFSFLFFFSFLKEQKGDDESGNRRQFVSCFHGMEWAAEYFCTELYPFFNLIVLGPCVIVSGVYCAIPSWLFVLHHCSFYAKNMTYFSLCTDYFVWVTCTEIKWTESTVDTFFFLPLIVITTFHIPPPPSRPQQSSFH